MTDEKLLTDLKKLAEELGKTPSSEECNKCSYTANVSTYRTRFGSWNNAKKKAGLLDSNKFSIKTNAELIESLQNFFLKHNRAPTQKECRASNGLAGPNTYKDNFNGWEAALDAAGILKNKVRLNQASDEELLESIKLFYKDNSRAPKHEDCNSGNYVYLKSHMVYVRRFGTFTNALTLAGVPINTPSYTSNIESEILEFIKEIYSGIILSSDRALLDSGLELDILLPELKLAIEVDGLYWHSDEYKEKRYHIEKTLETQSKGVRLIHIFENEWYSKRQIVKQRLSHLICNSENKIYARQCTLKEIPYTQAKEFLEKTHIQGSAVSSINIGLFYKEELVAVQTYAKARFTKDCEWELIRASSKYLVVGGVSKLFKYFLNTYSPNSVVSYCDLRWNTGDSYEKAGFILDNISEPNYWYFKDAYTLYSRVAFQKHKLADKLDKFDPNLSERENMSINGYKRIYDCGNLVFKYRAGGF